MRRIWLLLVLIPLLTAGDARKGNDQSDARKGGADILTTPGVIYDSTLGYNVGNEQTVERLLGLTEFVSLPAYTRYYFSSTGDDSNTPCTDSGSPCQTLDLIDQTIEDNCFVIAVLDGDGVWNTAAEIGASFDGGIGPPPDGCGDIESPGAFIISDEASTDPWNIDCTSMTSAQLEQDSESSGLLFGREGGVGTDENDGWLAASNGVFANCPQEVPPPTGATWSDGIRGNVLTLSVDFTNMTGHNRQMYSGKGAAGIMIDPAWSHADTADFDASCVGAGDPYDCCQGAGDCEMNTQMITNTDGVAILISNETYTWEIADPLTGHANPSLFGSVAASDLIGIGFTLTQSGSPARKTEAVRYECDTDSTEVDLTLAYVTITGFDESGDYGIETSATSTSCQYDTVLYEVLLNSIGYTEINHQGVINSQSVDNALDLDCSSLEGGSSFPLWLSLVEGSGSSSLMDLKARNSRFAESANFILLGILGYSSTHAEARTDIDSAAYLFCDGNEDCSDGWFEDNDGATSPPCAQERLIVLPTDEGATDAAGNGIDAWIPAYVTGDTIKAFRFGGDLD